ncbi:cytochrome c [Spirosoma sp. RP8]|uniref:Cytochrome c n=1 Tax=Spirosoma liriopis TaxID=2937440 RepID=A0ABT0HV90_9BACT|nr:cytochrome c [Spirosoma liriopis]
MVKAFAPVLMPGFPTLTEKEVKDLIDYIASYKSEETDFVR